MWINIQTNEKYPTEDTIWPEIEMLVHLAAQNPLPVQ